MNELSPASNTAPTAAVRKRRRVVFGLLVLAILGALAWAIHHELTAARTAAAAGKGLVITSPGLHSLPLSPWLESVEIRPAGKDLALSITEKIASDQSQWFWFQRGGGRRTITTHLPLKGPWEVVVRENVKTVTYTSGTYEYTFDHSDPNGSVSRDNHRFNEAGSPLE